MPSDLEQQTAPAEATPKHEVVPKDLQDTLSGLFNRFPVTYGKTTKGHKARRVELVDASEIIGGTRAKDSEIVAVINEIGEDNRFTINRRLRSGPYGFMGRKARLEFTPEGVFEQKVFDGLGDQEDVRKPYKLNSEDVQRLYDEFENPELKSRNDVLPLHTRVGNVYGKALDRHPLMTMAATAAIGIAAIGGAGYGIETGIHAIHPKHAHPTKTGTTQPGVKNSTEMPSTAALREFTKANHVIFKK